VLKAIEAPIRQIAENAGVEGSIVVGKILESKSETFGFDAQNEEYVDLIEKASSTRRRSYGARCRRGFGRGSLGDHRGDWSPKCRRIIRRRPCRAAAWAEWAA